MLTELAIGAPDDFDFEMGDWVVKHRRLKERLKDCHEWEEFEGESSTKKILGALGTWKIICFTFQIYHFAPSLCALITPKPKNGLFGG